MKRFHEAPKSIFNEVQLLTDGDYALVHLFEQDQEYWDMFKTAQAMGREIILDNSIFELGEAFDADKYAEWIVKLQPSWYIVPDCLDNMQQTVHNMELFVKMYGQLPGKRVGVVQGQTEKELRECYRILRPYCTMLAFSFNSKPFGETLQSQANERPRFIFRMAADGLLDGTMRHHLLGCALPQEFLAYRHKCIYSVDTSNPVVHGLKGIKYSPYGLDHKETELLCDLIDAVPTAEQWQSIRFNISTFRRFCNE